MTNHYVFLSSDLKGCLHPSITFFQCFETF